MFGLKRFECTKCKHLFPNEITGGSFLNDIIIYILPARGNSNTALKINESTRY
jgi:hypothetical protein